MKPGDIVYVTGFVNVRVRGVDVDVSQETGRILKEDSDFFLVNIFSLGIDIWLHHSCIDGQSPSTLSTEQLESMAPRPDEQVQAMIELCLSKGVRLAFKDLCSTIESIVSVRRFNLDQVIRLLWKLDALDECQVFAYMGQIIFVEGL